MNNELEENIMNIAQSTIYMIEDLEVNEEQRVNLTNSDSQVFKSEYHNAVEQYFMKNSSERKVLVEANETTRYHQYDVVSYTLNDKIFIVERQRSWPYDMYIKRVV